MTDRDRLIELIHDSDYSLDSVRLADYLIANGVILPPYKVGQTVYYIAFGKVYKGKCHAITIHKDGLQIHLYDYYGDNESISDKYVFLTREEAEKALERSKGNA